MKTARTAILLLSATLVVCGEYKVRVERNVGAAMRDGVVLKADIYRPDASGAFPVLLGRTPYGKGHGDQSSTAARGYIVVVQDTRGRGQSAGVFDPFFDDERDGYDTVEWAAALAGSNGKVGMFGGSYGGWTQVAAAMASPPHLVEIFPVFPAIDFGSHQILFEGGAFRQLLAESWSAAQTVELYGKTVGLMAGNRDAFLTLMRQLPAGDFMEALHREAMKRGGGGYFREWVKHAPGSGYWRRIDVSRKVDAIRVPGCYVGGWFDIFGPATAALFRAVAREAGTELARNRSQWIQGPWTHSGSKAPAGEAEFGKGAQISFGAAERAWHEYWLKGVANGVPQLAAARVFVTGENRWLELAKWPPEDAVPYRLHLGAQGRLDAAAGAAGRNRIVSNPADPVPTLGGKLCCHAGFAAGTFDQRPLTSRGDVLVYRSEPLARPVTMGGEGTVQVTVSTDAPDADVVVKLLDIAPDGKALSVADGVARLSYRDGRDRAVPMKPRRPARIRVKLGAVAHGFAAGHRIGVQVAGSDFPNYSVNLNSGETLERGSRPRVAHLTIHYGSDADSFVELHQLR
jgi:hypothetical protein